MRVPGGKFGVAVGLVGLLLAGCGSGGKGQGGSKDESGRFGFTKYAGGVDYPSVTGPGDKGYVAPGEGLRQLVPYGACALGEGTYANGYAYVNVNWASGKSCTKLTITPEPEDSGEADVPYSMRHGWLGGGLPGDVVVPWTDGSLLGVGRSVTLMTENGKQHPRAELPLTFNDHPEQETADDATVNTAVRVGSRLLIGGSETRQQVETPYLFASDDGGTTLRRVPLPPVGGVQPSTPLSELAAHGNDVVGFGGAASNAYDFHGNAGTLPFWHSADGGTHWTSGQLGGMPPGTQVHALLYASGHWFAFGGYAAKGAFYDSLPLVLASSDGTHWTRVDAPAMGDGVIEAATVDAKDRPLLVGSAPQHKASPNSRTVYCSSLWRGNGTTTGWARVSLGCGENPPTAAVTLPDARVLLAGNRDLWLGG